MGKKGKNYNTDCLIHIHTGNIFRIIKPSHMLSSELSYYRTIQSSQIRNRSVFSGIFGLCSSRWFELGLGDLYLPIEQLRGAPGPLCKFGWCHDGKIYFFVFVVTATKFEPVFPSKGALLLHWGGRPPPAAAAAAAAGGGLPPPALNPTAAALGSTPPGL